jgi:anti-sigma factor RsiW
MNCHEATPLAQAYSDGELDLVRSLELEEHLNNCPACSQAYKKVQVLKRVFASADLYHYAPTRLRSQIRASVGGKENPKISALAGWWKFLKPALPAFGVALLALLLIPRISGPSTSDGLGQEVISCHVRSLMVDHRTDVASSDQHTVKPWFQGKLDFTPPVSDFAEQGFPLEGGRLDYLQGRPAAALVYRHREHIINLFVWPSENGPEAAPRTSVRQGFNLVRWTNHGMNFWAVSDLNQVDLGKFCQLIK